jgi:hypothetical protein
MSKIALLHHKVQTNKINNIMKTRLFTMILILALATVLMTSCQKDETLVDPLIEEPGGLFLKKAEAGKTAYVYYLNPENGTAGKFYYPDNILFEVSKDEATAKVLNNFLLEVKDFHLLSKDEAVFLVKEVTSKPINLGNGPDGQPLYDLGMENKYAGKLPFTASDYGAQAIDGDARFNGVLKAEDYVFTINIDTKRILILDLKVKDSKAISSDITIKNDDLTFKVESKIWTLRFVQNSPVGNIFELVADGKMFSCYTISE